MGLATYNISPPICVIYVSEKYTSFVLSNCNYMYSEKIMNYLKHTQKYRIFRCELVYFFLKFVLRVDIFHLDLFGYYKYPFKCLKVDLQNPHV